VLDNEAQRLFEKGIYSDAISKWQEVLNLDSKIASH